MHPAGTSPPRRRWRTAAFSLALLAIVVTWLALARPSGPLPPRPSPTSSPAAAYATGGVTITIPAGWHLVAEGELNLIRFVDRPGQNTEAFRSVLQLTNFDAGGGQGPQCPDRAGAIPPDGVLLYVREVVGFEAGVTGVTGVPMSTWPIGLDTTPTVPLPRDACRGGREARWFAAGTFYEAAATIGPQASLADRAELAAAFGSMSFQGPQVAGNLSPTLRIGRVHLDGGSGDVGVYRGPTGRLCVTVATADTISCDLVPRPDTALRVGGGTALFLGNGPDLEVFVAGAVDRRVGSVRVSLGSGRWVEGRILPAPPQLGFPFRLFYAEGTAMFTETFLNRATPVVALDAHGHPIGRGSYMIRGG